MAFGVSTVVRDAAGPRSASGLATDGARVFVATPGGLVRYAKPPSGEPGDTETTALGWRSRRTPSTVAMRARCRRSSTKLGLAYCYSQILLEDNGIAYVLDGTTGPDQALVGGRDQIPEEDWQAARRVIETGTVLVGRIRKFDRWGLLKVAAGPIKDRQGRISATTGVDVNITTIQGRTRVVLLQVFFLGSVALVVATALSVGLARRLTRPLSLIKGAALRVAAGQTGQAVDVQRPLELFNLAQTFNEVSRQTRDHLEGLDRQWHGLEADRHARLLAKRLLTPSRVARVEETRRGGTGGTVNESGQVHEDGRTLVFLVEGSAADPGASLLLAARRDLARRILAGARRSTRRGPSLRFRGLVPGRLAIVDAHVGSRRSRRRRRPAERTHRAEWGRVRECHARRGVVSRGGEVRHDIGGSEAVSAADFVTQVAGIPPFSRLDGDEVASSATWPRSAAMRQASGSPRGPNALSREHRRRGVGGQGLPGRVFGMLSVLTGSPGVLDLRAGPEGACCLQVRRGPFFTIVHECPEILTWVLEQEPTAVLEGKLS